MADEQKTEVVEAETVEKNEIVDGVQTAIKKHKIVPKIFLDKKAKIEIAVVGYFSSEGELRFVLPKSEDGKMESAAESSGVLEPYEFSFTFTRVTYDKLNRYRTASMIYNSQDKNNTVNQLKLREFFLVFHLVGWDLKDDEGKDVKLKFDPSGTLSDESLEIIYSLPPSILDVVLAAYESKLNLV